MTPAEVHDYLKENEGLFPDEYVETIKKLLSNADPKLSSEIKNIKLKKPSTMTIISLFLGWLGIDRFILGDYVYGFIKLLSYGIFGLGWIIDIVRMKKDTKYFNAAKILVLFYPGQIKKPTFLGMILGNKEVMQKMKDVAKSAKELNDTMYMH